MDGTGCMTTFVARGGDADIVSRSIFRLPQIFAQRRKFEFGKKQPIFPFATLLGPICLMSPFFEGVRRGHSACAMQFAD